MSAADDELDRAQQEEHPGPIDLESVLVQETITDAIAHPPIVVNVDDSVGKAISLMREHGRGCVLVVRDGKLAGIFTERDVLMRIAGKQIDVEKTSVRSHMTADPV